MIKNLTLSLGITCLLLCNSPVLSEDRVVDGRHLPVDAADELSPGAEAFTNILLRESEPEYPPEVMQELNPFFRDAKLDLNLRNFYLNRSGIGAENQGARESWAQGGSLSLQTGKISDVFDISVEGFTSQKWYGPKDRDGGAILKPEQRSFTVLGVANPRFYYADHVLSLYRQRVPLPFINEQDSRMVPNTFEAYFLGVPRTSNQKVQWGLGYVDKIKRRNASNFITMSEAVGATNSKGLSFAGLRFEVIENLNLMALEHYVEDVFNVAYFELDYSNSFCGEDGSIRFNIQHMRQDSVGEELRAVKSEFSTQMWGGQASIGYRSLLFRFSLTGNSKDADLVSPYGSYAGYTGSTVQDFNRAGEITWRPSISFDLKRIGFPGTRINTAYARANRAVNQLTGESLPDKRETDVTIDIRPDFEWAENLWIRLRSAYVQEEGGDSFEEYRVITNYDFDIPRSVL